MSDSTKYYIAWIVSLVCLGAALFGLKNMSESQSTAGIMGVGLLAGGVVIGIIATLARYYLKVRKMQPKDQQQIAVETLSRMASADRTRAKR